MRQTLTTISELAGIALIVVGIGIWSIAAALVAAGLALVGIGYIEGAKE
jgi:hypothetical protein